MSTPSPSRILVVDDDPLFLKALGDTLRDEGHVVVAANDGQACIGAFQSALTGPQPFALVITDLAMNEVDGRQVAMAVKAASPIHPCDPLDRLGQMVRVQGQPAAARGLRPGQATKTA